MAPNQVGRKPHWQTNQIDTDADQWMLDRWTPDGQHATSVVYRDRQFPDGFGGTVVEREYRVVCTCGWRSIELVRPVLEMCPVRDALTDRARRQKKPLERTEWCPYVVPHIEPDPRD